MPSWLESVSQYGFNPDDVDSVPKWEEGASADSLTHVAAGLLRQISALIREARDYAAGIENRDDLSPVGKERQLTEGGHRWITKLAQIDSSSKAIPHAIGKLRADAIVKRSPTEQVVRALRFNEIRAALLQMESMTRINAVLAAAAAGDEETLEAIENAPQVVSIIEGDFLARARTILADHVAPEKLDEVRRLESAQRALTSAIGSARTELLQRAKLPQDDALTRIAFGTQAAA